ncbi:calcium/sodium antiporter [Marinomonas sp. M1K-6]|uniref:Calcium/sodium antiporter n=1 Tax=Marinomonas profundi TaxID=2726122 RepID=A0A847R9G6_9GAMM|nr:calcium/sodium antiporter [Marinomonas profundi]NLQ17594.1 calcium/sodium antiporter [Marinomonas profundi]UDV02189.1 calcium/sodium antiporter [Marinomonas profundi]
MTLALLAIVCGFVLLVWSADRFVDGAAATAKHFGMPSLLIGMVVVGFGTSAPEMVVSAMAAIDGKPDLAMGNALGSNIVNIGLILGITALIAPITVNSSIVRKELPLLLLICLLLGGLLWDGAFSFIEAIILLVGFLALVVWSVFSALKAKGDNLGVETEQALVAHQMTVGKAVFWLVVGLILLIISSRILVWGAVSIAQTLGISNLIIGLTIIALGTSLPELAASVIAARKGEHDLAIGNIVGSNMFNILAVVGIAGIIEPIRSMAPEVFNRDWLVMLGMTIMLFAMAYGFGREGRINRLEGGVLIAAFAAYNIWLVISVLG